MTRFPKAGPLAGTLALLVGIMLVAPPAFAVDTRATAPGRPLAAAAAARVSAMPAAAVAQAAQGTAASPAPDGKPFFKSTKGIVAAVLLATGAAWVIASRSNDAVHSPGRK